MRRMTESVKPAVRSESGCIGRSPLLFIPICLLGYFALYRGSTGSSMPFRGNFAFWKIADIIKETFEAHIKDTPVYVFESVEEAMKKWDNENFHKGGSWKE